MNPPHNKISGRKYSSVPRVGIPLALEILNDKKSHRNDILSATCYLGYRVLDGTYKDVDFIWPKIQYCRKWSLKIGPPDGNWFRTRWVCSYLILSIYFKLLVLKEKPPQDLIDELCNKKHIVSHPPQFVNVLRGYALDAVNKFLLGDRDGVEEKMKEGITCYRESMNKYIIDPNRPDSIIYEAGEAIEALNAILEVKYSTKEDYDKLLKKWKPKMSHSSRGPFFRSLVSIYNKKTIQSIDIEYEIFESE